jgi:hypothetical protein
VLLREHKVGLFAARTRYQRFQHYVCHRSTDQLSNRGLRAAVPGK